MLPHHVNSWTIPVDLGIVSRESAKIPKTGTLYLYLNKVLKKFSFALRAHMKRIEWLINVNFTVLESINF